MKGKAIVHGAVTIINAISTGKGGALGIDLKTEAVVELLKGSKEIEVEIIGGKKENPTLAKESVRSVLNYFSISKIGARVRIKSEIPIARGLKSSSTAANSIVLATLSALDKKIPDEDAVKLGVEAAFKAKVTITGAYDDACASYFGGIVLTDNYERKVLKRERADEGLVAVVYVPKERTYTQKFPKERLYPLKYAVKMAFELAMHGEYWKALTLNGLIHSSALGLPTKPAADALLAGALASGLSGTGPSIVAIADKKHASQISRLWSELGGEVLMANLTNQKARCV